MTLVSVCFVHGVKCEIWGDGTAKADQPVPPENLYTTGRLNVCMASSTEPVQYASMLSPQRHHKDAAPVPARHYCTVISQRFGFASIRRSYAVQSAFLKVKKVIAYLFWNTMSQLRSVTCHMGSHSVTCYPTQVNAPSQSGRYSIYLPQRDRRLSWPRWLVTYRDGLPARRQSPIQVLTGPGVD